MATYRDDFYRLPALYDLEYAQHTEDLAFYGELAQKAGRVLELGAGTGRVTQAMVNAGATVGTRRRITLVNVLATIAAIITSHALASVRGPQRHVSARRAV